MPVGDLIARLDRKKEAGTNREPHSSGLTQADIKETLDKLTGEHFRAMSPEERRIILRAQIETSGGGMTPISLARRLTPGGIAKTAARAITLGAASDTSTPTISDQQHVAHVLAGQFLRGANIRMSNDRRARARQEEAVEAGVSAPRQSFGDVVKEFAIPGSVFNKNDQDSRIARIKEFGELVNKKFEAGLLKEKDLLKLRVKERGR